MNKFRRMVLKCQYVKMRINLGRLHNGKLKLERESNDKMIKASSVKMALFCGIMIMDENTNNIQIIILNLCLAFWCFSDL